MFKAINRETREAVTILDSKWVNQLDDLRALDRQDILSCQGCQQPVRVRAGTSKRWHFAHKHRQDCAYDRESPSLLEARAVLYHWLETKWREQVTLEHQPHDHGLPRPIDCWVMRPTGAIAYWIVEGRMPAQARSELKQRFTDLHIQVHWVFVADLLRPDPDHPNNIYLSTTERDFLRPSDYDQVGMDSGLVGGQSLHYLNPNSQTLTTYRSLRCIHAPQGYRGQRVSHPLKEVLVSPKTGEFVHPGEHERLREWRTDQQAVERQRQQDEKHRAGVPAPLPQSLSTLPPNVPTPLMAPSLPASPKPATTAATPVPVCEICGAATRDYWYHNKATNTCRCRVCARQGKW